MGNKRKFILLNQHKQLATFHKALIQLITTNQLIFIITRIMKHKGILFLPVLILRVIFGPFWVLMTLSRLLALLSSSTQDPYTLSRLNHLSTVYPYTLSTQVVKFQMIVWKKDGESLYPSLKQSKTENMEFKLIFSIPPNKDLYTFSNEYWERP